MASIDSEKSNNLILVRCYWCNSSHTTGYKINSNQEILYLCSEHWDILCWVYCMFNLSFTIPATVRITARTTYRVMWIKEFQGSSQIGECDFNKKQIILKTGLSPETTFWVFFHEVLHAISHHYKYPMTESQVNKTEVALSKVSRLNKWG